MDSGMKPPKYEEVVLTPPNSSVYTVSAPGQYNLQIPDQSPPPQLSSPQVKVSVKAQCVSCPTYHKKVMTKVIVGYCIVVYCICILSLVYLGKW